MTKSIYVCNVSSEEKPLELPTINFDKPKKLDKQKNYSGQSNVGGNEETPLELPTTNFKE